MSCANDSAIDPFASASDNSPQIAHITIPVEGLAFCAHYAHLYFFGGNKSWVLYNPYNLYTGFIATLLSESIDSELDKVREFHVHLFGNEWYLVKTTGLLYFEKVWVAQSNVEGNKISEYKELPSLLPDGTPHLIWRNIHVQLMFYINRALSTTFRSAFSFDIITSLIRVPEFEVLDAFAQKYKITYHSRASHARFSFEITAGTDEDSRTIYIPLSAVFSYATLDGKTRFTHLFAINPDTPSIAPDDKP